LHREQDRKSLNLLIDKLLQLFFGNSYLGTPIANNRIVLDELSKGKNMAFGKVNNDSHKELF